MLAGISDYATATHAAAVITLLAPPTGYANVLTSVAWSYSGGTPSGGSIKIEDGSGNVVLFEDITAAGSVTFDPPKRFTAATATIIMLADAGSGIVGKVSLIGKYANTLTGMTT